RPNGAVSPCIFWEEQPIGLYPETSLGEVERSPLLVEIVDGLKSGNPCGTCNTCTERKHALYFRLQWRQQAGERLEQLGAGPGSGGVAEEAAQKAGAPTSGRSPAPLAPGLPSPSAWIKGHAPAEPFDRVLLVGDEAWASQLLRAGFAKRVDIVTSSASAGAPAFWPASGEPQSGEPEPSIHRLPIHPRRPILPAAAYQAACCIGGLSSHLRLERLLDAVLDALEPGGRLFVDDYVGPARHQWNPRTGAVAAAAYRRLPAAVRRFERLPMPPVEGDCARATRSGDVARLIRTGFRAESVRPYGGDLVAPLATSVDWSRLPEADLQRLVEGSGAGGHYALTVARPRAGWQRRLAGMRYRIGPKVRRVFIYEPRRARDLAFQALRGKV
ncbi:MAG: hypothetical protein OXU63_07895, partial [Acidobacteriota bacterium]|nr:hypothetical protein [Acidobacteriota bacterium]